MANLTRESNALLFLYVMYIEIDTIWGVKLLAAEVAGNLFICSIHGGEARGYRNLVSTYFFPGTWRTLLCCLLASSVSDEKMNVSFFFSLAAFLVFWNFTSMSLSSYGSFFHLLPCFCFVESFHFDD